MYLSFPSGYREQDILLIFGVYKDFIEDKVILRGLAIFVDNFIGRTKYMQKVAHHNPIPDLGFIPGAVESVW